MKKLILMALILGVCSPAWASVDVNRLADCIKIAESSKAHPYGIMVKYKHTTPRQACINTIIHALRDWNGKGEFIAFLGSRYAPIGVKNDPKWLNRHWIKNVSYLYKYGYKK